MEISTNNPLKNKVHRILAHSYSFNFILFLIGMTLDLIFEVKLFPESIARILGVVFLLLGTVLVIRAQKSHKIPKENVRKEDFLNGPYKYTRHPTHYGLSLLLLGFGLMINAAFVVISAVISFVISKFIFIKKQEAVLEAKYGTPYLEYKKSVKF